MPSPALHTFPIKDPPAKHKNTLRLANCPLPHTPSLKRPPVLKGTPSQFPHCRVSCPLQASFPRDPLPPGSPTRPAHQPLSASLTFSTAAPPRERFNCRSPSPAPGSGFLPCDWLWLIPSRVSISQNRRPSLCPAPEKNPPSKACNWTTRKRDFFEMDRSSVQSLLNNSQCQSYKEGCPWTRGGIPEVAP